MRTGVDIFAHGVCDQDMDDEFVKLVSARLDVVLVPNLPSRGVATDLGWLAGALLDDEIKALEAAGDNPEAPASISVTRRCGTGGTGSAQCSRERSGRDA